MVMVRGETACIGQELYALHGVSWGLSFQAGGVPHFLCGP
jgi:hypothetical protein